MERVPLWRGALALCWACLWLCGCGGAAEPARPEVVLTLAQRSSAVLPGWEDAVQVRIDDITRGQVMVEVLAPDGQRIAGPQSLRPGDTLPFPRSDQTYDLRLERLDNALVGQDFARFQVAAQGAQTTRSSASSVASSASSSAMPGPAAGIEALLSHLATLDGVQFLRNGRAYAPAEAVQHLRQKWAHRTGSVHSVEDFIVQCASVSEVSGQPYQLQWPDGRIVELATYLRDQAAAR